MKSRLVLDFCQEDLNKPFHHKNKILYLQLQQLNIDIDISELYFCYSEDTPSEKIAIDIIYIICIFLSCVFFLITFLVYLFLAQLRQWCQSGENLKMLKISFRGWVKSIFQKIKRPLGSCFRDDESKSIFFVQNDSRLTPSLKERIFSAS